MSARPWSPGLALARLALALLAGACSPREPRSLLVVTLDTTRADALGCYGGPETPALDRLAREGVLFERAHTAVPITLPAHATLFTGLYPLRHGVRDNGRNPLPAGARTLAEAARAGGLQTAACVGAVVLDGTFGLAQGFELYDAPLPPVSESPGVHLEGERPARAVVDAALEWLGARERERPFFLWVHLYDAHTPYAPPPEFDGTSLRAKYEGEVRAVDRELGRLLEALRADGTLERTLVIVAGDHGEAFGEHGEHGHSAHAYESTLHVPLLVRAPFWPRFPAGTRTPELVGLADLAPTACEALGLDAPPDVDGRSLWSAPPPPGRGLYFESYYGYLNFGWSPLAGWIDGETKLLQAGGAQLFDLAADAGEERDLAPARPAEVRRAQVALSELAQHPALAAEDAGVSEDMLAALRGLGYASTGGEATGLPHPLADTELPTPASMVAPYERTLDAIQMGERGDLAGAERVLSEVRAQNPRNPFLLDHLAGAQAQQGKLAEAAETLRALLELDGGRVPGHWFRLARCLEGLGRRDEAIAALQAARALDPTRAKYTEELVRLLRAAGRADEAAALESGRAAAGGG